MTIKILAFGSIAEILGTSEMNSDSIHSTSELKIFLTENYPALAESKFSIARNKQIISDDQIFQEGDVIALLPPFSGG